MWDWIGFAALFIASIVFRRQLDSIDQWLIRVGVVPDNRWVWFFVLGMACGVAIVDGSAFGWIAFGAVFAFYSFLLWSSEDRNKFQ